VLLRRLRLDAEMLCASGSLRLHGFGHVRCTSNCALRQCDLQQLCSAKRIHAHQVLSCPIAQIFALTMAHSVTYN
jgi:hypothetical protein